MGHENENPQNNTLINDVVGQSNEASIQVEGVKTIALLDTGSSVSTVSDTFHRSFLGHLQIKPLDHFLKVECADGQSLPYSGYIETSIVAQDLDADKEHPCIMLVVPDTRFNSKVPILLGTNVLQNLMETCQEQHGTRFLQTSCHQTSWFITFRCLSLREKRLVRNHHRLSIVKSAEKNAVTIGSNQKVKLKGYIDKGLPYHACCALLQPCKDATIDSELDIAPSLISYNFKGNGLVEVDVSNLSARTITISPKAVMCELQPVTVEDEQHGNMSSPSSPLSQINFNTEDLTPEQTERGKHLIEEYEDIFSKNDNDIGYSTDVKHRIDLYDERPFKLRHRRIPPSMYNEVKSHLQQLLTSGIIRRSHSPWSSNVVLVRKKDGSLRMCVDYRELNKRTIPDSYALPRIEEVLDSLGGSKYFSVLDMKSGYYQVELNESHKERTAFSVGPLGFWEFQRLPFGLNNSPATYQRLMEDILGDYHLNICLIYLDDLIIFAKTYEEHLERLQMVLQRLREAGLKLSAKKCKFFQTKVVYVGHLVSEEGIEADPAKVESIKNWPTPTTPEEVRRFLGFAGYYRKFVKDFSRIARPLNDLMPTPVKKSRKKHVQKAWLWDHEQQQAFDVLKYILSSPPVLGYTDYEQPFELHTDASKDGLGAVLYQTQNGKKRVISYASRGLNKAERNYPVHKLEFLALKWAITEKLKEYLYGAKNFTVYTDNNPLTYVLTSAKLDATGHRWLAALAAYNFSIKYRAGSCNQDADALSRYPREKLVNEETVHAICNGIDSNAWVECVCFTETVVDDAETGAGSF